MGWTDVLKQTFGNVTRNPVKSFSTGVGAVSNPKNLKWGYGNIVKPLAKEFYKGSTVLSDIGNTMVGAPTTAFTNTLMNNISGRGQRSLKQNIVTQVAKPTQYERFFHKNLGSTFDPIHNANQRDFIASGAEMPLWLYGGSGVVKGAIKPTLKTAVTQGLKVGAVSGIPYGVTQTYREGDIKKLPQNIATSVGTGALLGGGISGLGYGANKVLGAVIKEMRNVNTKGNQTKNLRLNTEKQSPQTPTQTSKDIVSSLDNSSTPNKSGKMQGVLRNNQQEPRKTQLLKNQESLQQSSSDIIPQSGTAKIGENTADGFVKRVQDKFSNIYTQAIDRYNPLNKLGRAAGQEQTVKNALAGHYGAGSTAKYHIDFELKPILNEVPIDDLRSYTIAKRDLELAGRNITGSDAQAANQVLNNLSKNKNFAQIEQAAQKLYDYQDKVVQDYLVNTGVISKEAYNAMKANNQSYVPFKRVMDEVDDFMGFVPGKQPGSVASQNVIKKIEGSNRQIHDPLESIIENTYKAVAVGKRQRVAQTLIGLQDQLPPGIIQEIPKNAKLGNTPNIALFVNGKVKHYAVPKDVAEAAKGMNEDQLSTIVQILAAPTRVFRATATGVNPEFALPNIARDIQGAFVNVGANPLRWTQSLFHYLKQDEVYQDFLKHGGLTSRLSIDRPVLKETVKELTTKGGIDIKSPRSLYHVLEKIGEASEQPTRIMMYQKKVRELVKKGLPLEQAKQEATFWAQEGTVNFARRGSATKSVNALYAFMNARVQGVDRLARSFKERPAQTAFRVGLITQVPAVTLYAYNRQFPGYFDDRIINKTDRDNNFIFMLDNEHYLKVPKGEIGKLANPTEQALMYADGKGGNVAEGIWSSLKAFSPIDNPGDFIPTTLRPIAEGILGKNFFTGQSITPTGKENYPAEAKYSNSTAPLYRAAGDLLNISPNQIQNAARGYLTGYARMTEMATEPLFSEEYKKGMKDADPFNKTPVLRRFIGGPKMSKEEYAQSQVKKSQVDQYKIQDINSGIRKGDLTPEQGQSQINKVLQSSGKTSSSGGIISMGGQFAYPKSDGGYGFAKTEEKAKIAQAKYELGLSGNPGDRVEVGNTIMKVGNDGTVRTVTTGKIQQQVADYKLSQDITAAKDKDDLTTWVNLSFKKINNLKKDILDLDEEFDAVEIARKQQQIIDIRERIAKYKSQGGFKKGKKAKKQTLASAGIKLTAPKTIKEKTITVAKGATGGKNGRIATSKPKRLRTKRMA